MLELIDLLAHKSPVHRASHYLIAGLVLAATSLGDTTPDIFAKSAKRISIVQAQADKFVEDQGFEGLSEAEVYDIVVNAVIEKGIDCKLRPTGTLITLDMCKEAAQKKALAATEKALPEPSKEELVRQAAEKYPLLEKGEEFKAVFMPNPARRVTVEGRYEGFDGKHVLVNHKRYALESLRIVEPKVDNPRLLVDTEQNAEQRELFQASAEREYLRQRSQMLEDERKKALRLEVARAITSNQNNGFIFYDRQWESLRDVVKSEIGRRREAWLAEKRAEEERKRREAEEAARRAAEEAAAAAAKEGDPAGDGTPPPGEVEFDIDGKPVFPPPPLPEDPGGPKEEQFRPKTAPPEQQPNPPKEGVGDIFRPAVPDGN